MKHFLEFNRNIINELSDWAIRKNRKPLILRGARQVGKTTAVTMFSKQFDQYLYVNLEKKEDRDIFLSDMPFGKMVDALFFLKNISRNSGRILIFIDEIQNAPQAVSYLRYFLEDEPDLYVIASGSLFETILDRKINIPVGRVDYLMMRPVSFSEYLSAIGQNVLLDALERIPCEEYTHLKLLEEFCRFVLIGGMPEIIKQYSNSRDLTELSPIYETLLTSYTEDMEKYARNLTQARIMSQIFESILSSAGNRIKFQGFGQTPYKSREIQQAFSLLEKAMLISLVYPHTKSSIPIQPNRRKSPRLHFLDVGLINYHMGIQKDLILTSQLDSVYQGKIAEMIVGQEILSTSFLPSRKINFGTKDKKQSSAEIDYLLQFDQKLIPIEVKSGKTGMMRALQQYMENSEHPFAVRFYSGNIRIDSPVLPSGKKYTLLNLPYYLSIKINEYLSWFMNSTD
ncbi:MAG: ATP-binding protein [Fidelibacterota bacterium]